MSGMARQDKTALTNGLIALQLPIGPFDAWTSLFAAIVISGIQS